MCDDVCDDRAHWIHCLICAGDHRQMDGASIRICNHNPYGAYSVIFAHDRDRWKRFTTTLHNHCIQSV